MMSQSAPRYGYVAFLPFAECSSSCTSHQGLNQTKLCRWLEPNWPFADTAVSADRQFTDALCICIVADTHPLAAQEDSGQAKKLLLLSFYPTQRMLVKCSSRSLWPASGPQPPTLTPVRRLAVLIPTLWTQSYV